MFFGIFQSQVIDLPQNENWTIDERGERNVNDVSPEALEYNWSGGYYVYFTSSENNKVTYIDQYLSIYPEDQIIGAINIAYPDAEPLTNPSIGEHSKAIKIKTSSLGQVFVQYRIVFVKNNVLVTLSMWGANPDYLILKELAQKAYNKIDGYGKPFDDQTLQPSKTPTQAQSQNIIINYYTKKVNSIGQYEEAKQGKIFLVITMNIENHGYKEFSTNPNNFYVISNKIKYDNYWSSSLDDYLESVDLLDGGSLKGSLAFEVPLNFEISEIDIQWSGYGDYNIIFIPINPPTPTPTPIPTPKMSIDEIKKNAIDVNYDDLLRNNEKYIGKIVNYRGIIAWSLEKSIGSYNMGVLLDTGDSIYVNYEGSRFLQYDTIDVWGRVVGVKRYIAINNAQVTLPEIDVLHIELVKKASDR